VKNLLQTTTDEGQVEEQSCPVKLEHLEEGSGIPYGLWIFFLDKNKHLEFDMQDWFP
jgi:hypothetical protein